MNFGKPKPHRRYCSCTGCIPKAPWEVQEEQEETVQEDNFDGSDHWLFNFEKGDLIPQSGYYIRKNDFQIVTNAKKKYWVGSCLRLTSRKSPYFFVGLFEEDNIVG